MVLPREYAMRLIRAGDAVPLGLYDHRNGLVYVRLGRSGGWVDLVKANVWDRKRYAKGREE